jgi:SNF2-related domain/Helicase conserved C-terminal domain/Bacterial SNF2 helicase associated/SWIM zinc finger
VGPPAEPNTASSPPSDGLVAKLRDEVPHTTFRKGRDYAEQGRVQGWSEAAGTRRGIVAGSSGETYHPEISLNPEGPVRSSCDCPAWGKYGGPHCKHVVALALADAPRLPTGTPATEQRASEHRAEVVPLPALAKLESWLGLSAAGEPSFIYRLSPAQPRGSGRSWVFDARRRDAKDGGPIAVKRFLSLGVRLAPADERVLTELAHHTPRFDGKFILGDDEVAELIPLLRTRRVVYRGTLLVFSSEPARAQVHLATTADGARATLEFQLPDGRTTGFDTSMLLIGRRTASLLDGQTAYALEPELPPRMWRAWAREPSMSFPPAQLERVLSFFAAHLPRLDLRLRADGLDVLDDSPPGFVLTLEGSAELVRAQLAARYGSAVVPVSPTAIHLGYAASTGGKGRTLHRRQEAAEREAGQRLTALGFRYDAASAVYQASGDAAVDFWISGLASLPGEWERFIARPVGVKVRRKLRPRVRVATGGQGWFELDARFEADDQALDLGAVRLWLQSGRRFIPLKDGSFAEADREELTRAADLLEEAGASAGGQTTRVPAYQAGPLDALSALGDQARFETRARTAIAEFKELSRVPAVPPPEGLLATLRHYQEAGLSWLWFLHRHGLSGILADDMGLGKTVQALALLQQARNVEGPQPSLVVAPTSVLPNWLREAERFTPGLRISVWHGQDRRERVEDMAGADLVLTSYALARRDRDELTRTRWRYVLLDEAQSIKNADSATAQACKSLPADHRLALTGTPLENRLSELWSIFDFLMPGFLGAEEDFAERYEQPIEVGADLAVRERLRRRIQPFLLRRLKTEVAQDLPPKTETVAYCEMEPAQAALYREVLEQGRAKVYDSIERVGFRRARVSILAALLRLRQVCCDPRLLKMPPSAPLPGSAKLDRFAELTDDLIAEGHRALVFSQFTEMLRLLEANATARSIPFVSLDGRTRDRMARVDAFNAPDGPPLFFISLKAGGTGLNLTAADYVLHYDPWWNPAVEDQATDRTHRIGQTRAVISYKLITRGTVEEKILALQQRKRELAQGILGPGGGLAEGLSQEDVEALFAED